jgi:hypothetical protein
VKNDHYIMRGDVLFLFVSMNECQLGHTRRGDEMDCMKSLEGIQKSRYIKSERERESAGRKSEPMDYSEAR